MLDVGIASLVPTQRPLVIFVTLVLLPSVGYGRLRLFWGWTYPNRP